MDASIIIPIYNPNKATFDESLKSIKNQIYNGRVEIIKIDGKLGLAKSINEGIKKARHEIIITLHQDCLPENKFWLKKLLSPFKNKNTIVSVSKVHLPVELWNRFDIFAKALTLKEKGTITPLMDEKGCAYRKSILKKVGLFNEKDFRTAGEDFDLYLRLKDLDEITYPNTKIIHVHPTSLKNRLKKAKQNANGYGALIKKYGRNMPGWEKGYILATPLLGIVASLLSFPFKKSIFLFFPFLVISPIFHFYYLTGFWKGFLIGRQTI